MRTKSRVKLALNSPPLSSLENMLRFVRRNHIVVPAKEQHVDYYQIVKEQPIVRMLEPEGAWRLPRRTDADQAACGSTFKARAHAAGWMVEVNGIEPMTPCLQSRCSPS